MPTIRLWLSVVCFFCGLGAARGVASYVKAICDRNPIHTTALKTHGDNGFKISLEGQEAAHSPDKYRPGQTYTGEFSWRERGPPHVSLLLLVPLGNQRIVCACRCVN